MSLTEVRFGISGRLQFRLLGRTTELGSENVASFLISKLIERRRAADSGIGVKPKHNLQLCGLVFRYIFIATPLAEWIDRREGMLTRMIAPPLNHRAYAKPRASRLY